MLKDIVGFMSNPRGGIVEAPEKNTNTSSREHSTSPSTKCRFHIIFKLKYIITNPDIHQGNQ